MHADDRGPDTNGVVPVSDRRRFRPDGSLREPAAEDVGGIDLVDETALNGDDTRLGGAADIDGPPAPSRTPAEDWERRALAAEARLRELADSLTRGRADLEAARARVERDREQRVREAFGRAFERILVALDNLERALAHAADGPLAASPTAHAPTAGATPSGSSPVSGTGAASPPATTW